MTLTTHTAPSLEGDWPEQGDWTYEDYLRLPDTGWRYEIIEGVLYMAPPPNTFHQLASNALSTELTIFVRRHDLGTILYAPVDIILTGRKSNVQPDILFLAKDRLDLLKDRGIEGPPDLAIEILSPSNWIVDRQEKFRLYESTGVKEYWIVDVREKTIEVYCLQDGAYELNGKYTGGDTVPSRLLEGFTIGVDDVCER